MGGLNAQVDIWEQSPLDQGDISLQINMESRHEAPLKIIFCWVFGVAVHQRVAFPELSGQEAREGSAKGV